MSLGPIVVQKYGGSSVATAEKILAIAERVKTYLETAPASRRRRVGDGEDDRSAGRARQAGVEEPARARLRSAARVGRAGGRRHARARAAGQRRAGDRADRRAMQHPHGRLVQSRAHSVDRHGTHRGRAREGQGRHRRRLPGRDRERRSDDARTRRRGYHGRGGRGGAECVGLRDLHRRRRRAVGRPERGARRPVLAGAHLRSRDRDGVERREGAAPARGRDLHVVQHSHPHPFELSSERGDVDSRRSRARWKRQKSSA